MACFGDIIVNGQKRMEHLEAGLGLDQAKFGLHGGDLFTEIVNHNCWNEVVVVVGIGVDAVVVCLKSVMLCRQSSEEVDL
jgi:hypothetical protein